MMNFDAFVSYSSKDKPAADAACAMMEAAGIRCWIAPRDILPGHEYAAAIIEAIDHCRVMVLVFSASANESRQIHREVERAVSKGVAVVPLRIEDIVPTKSMEYFIGTIHWLDAWTPPLELHLNRLIETVKALVNAQVQAYQPEQRFRVSGQPSTDKQTSSSDAVLPAASSVSKVAGGRPSQHRNWLAIALSTTGGLCVLALIGYLIAAQWLQVRQSSGPSFCPGEESSRSISGQSPTVISFTNYRAAPIRLYWLDYSGARKLYATIYPGQSHVQNTYLSHPWVVTDLADRCIGLYEPETQRRDYAIR